jgi:D-alanine-D-alanine ligase-like ATP-grasp enzyme
MSTMNTPRASSGAPGLLLWLDRLSRARDLFRPKSRAAGDAERHLASFYEEVWRDAAERLDAAIEPLGYEVFEITRGRFRTRVQRNSTAIDDLAVHGIVRTKPVVHRLLEAAGLPVPRSFTFSLRELDQAGAFLEMVGRDCVVKPANDSGGGRGVTTGITSRFQLYRAACAAARGGKDVLVEEQVAGHNYRLLFLDGRLLDAVRRDPPTAVGDGRSTVEELVRAENDARLREGHRRSHGPLTFDLDMEYTLSQAGLKLGSVPRAGQVLRLKTATNENNRLDNKTVTALVSPEVVGQCSQAAGVCGLRLAGVDILTPDPGVPLRQAGGVILEVNSPPGYYWHYRKEGEAVPVALHVLRALAGEPGPRSMAIPRRLGSALEREEAAV